MKSVLALLTFFLTFMAISVYGKFADMVIDAEKPAATRLDEFTVSEYTYHFLARAYNGTIVVQIRYENDTAAVSEYFTPTGQLTGYLVSAQQQIVQVTAEYGYTGTPSFQDLEAYRYNPDGSDVAKRDADASEGCRSIPEPGSFEERSLEKRGARCGQFCGKKRHCIDRNCLFCLYTGGACRHQRSCYRSRA